MMLWIMSYNNITIEEIEKRTILIFRYLPLDKAILFGSYAEGKANNQSNIDLYIDTILEYTTDVDYSLLIKV